MIEPVPEIERPRVSVVQRLLPAFAWAIPDVGSAVGSLMFIRAMDQLRYAETAGLASALRGMQTASLPVLVTLYLGVALGFIGIVVYVIMMFTGRKTASPPGWFLILPGLLCTLPVCLFWAGESLFIGALTPGGHTGGMGIAGIASTVSMLQMATIIAAVIAVLVSLVMSVIPFKGKPGRRFGSLIAMLFFEIVMVVAAVTFQLQFMVLYDVVNRS